MREEILRLADRLPAGRHDPRAFAKLTHEFCEMLAERNRIDAATELADIVYYRCKLDALMRLLTLPIMLIACARCRCSVPRAYRVCAAKYRLRARPGNPKDRSAERQAVAAALQ